MSDTALSDNDPVKVISRGAQKYRPKTDGPRMKIYMQNVRDKKKAGYSHMTVKRWIEAGKPVNS